MAGAAGSFPRLFDGGEESSPEFGMYDRPRSDRTAETFGPDCPDVFELLELHRRWFGCSRETDETAQATGSGPVEAGQPEEPLREQGALVYRIIRNEPNVASEPETSGQRSAARHETIAETLALAEQVFQQLPELPQHSRLQASLSALEAALAGTTLSDLESALAGHEMTVRQEAG